MTQQVSSQKLTWTIDIKLASYDHSVETPTCNALHCSRPMLNWSWHSQTSYYCTALYYNYIAVPPHYTIDNCVGLQPLVCRPWPSDRVVASTIQIVGLCRQDWTQVVWSASVHPVLSAPSAPPVSPHPPSTYISSAPPTPSAPDLPYVFGFSHFPHIWGWLSLKHREMHTNVHHNGYFKCCANLLLVHTIEAKRVLLAVTLYYVGK